MPLPAADKLVIACSPGLAQSRNNTEIIGTGRSRQQQRPPALSNTKGEKKLWRFIIC
jgi:hypothetical protein